MVVLRMPSPGSAGDPANPDFIGAAGKYARRVHEVYDARAHWHRRLYRLSGVIVIFLGASLPLLTTLDFAHKDLTISLAGVAVSVVTSLRGFYRWDHGWALLRATEFAISDAYWDWMATTRATETTETRHQATLQLIERIGQIRRNEANSYLKDLPFPDNR